MHILIRKAHFNCITDYSFVYFDIIVIKCVILPNIRRNQIIHLHITLPYLFFFYRNLLVFIQCTFLFVRVFMVHSVIEILVIKFFVISVKFTNTVMKTNHEIFVHHKTFGLSNDFVSIFVPCLGVERTEDHTSF